MAKAGVAGTTVYVPAGHPVPDLPGVRFVGPGAPADASEVGESPSPTSEAATEEGEQPSPGSSSSTSSDRSRPSGEPSSPSRRKPVRTTGPRSPKGPAGSSGAPSDATTSGPETGASDN